MSYVETALTIISLISSIIGYALGQRGNVSDKTCLERQGHVQEAFCLQINALTNSVELLRRDITDLRKDRLKNKQTGDNQ